MLRTVSRYGVVRYGVVHLSSVRAGSMLKIVAGEVSTLPRNDFTPIMRSLVISDDEHYKRLV
ncbi:hypothetical protein VMCG_00149 [Cytospora schulzeri]|uniref:Uncharacterized protein n=1 Tax=Cytospora schulzeri TaxID=448051 RepID=A0A423X913_9PEZI|nr:hypothetical protein VMCG_00149 [Valsa malicola]